MPLLTTLALGRPCLPSQGFGYAQKARVQPQAAARGASAAARWRRRSGATATKAAKEEDYVAAVGSDLNWNRVAKDIKHRLAKVMKKGQAEQLQTWLNETRLSCDTDAEAERGQAEMVAQQEADFQGLAGVHVDITHWLESSGSEEDDARAAGMLTMRVLQAFHDNAGEAFDDENDDDYWRLQGYLPGGLVEVLDHDTLKRMIKAYLSLPFSGV